MSSGLSLLLGAGFTHGQAGKTPGPRSFTFYWWENPHRKRTPLQTPGIDRFGETGVMWSPDLGVGATQPTQTKKEVGDPQVKTGILWLELRPGGKALSPAQEFPRAGTVCLLCPHVLKHIC